MHTLVAFVGVGGLAAVFVGLVMLFFRDHRSKGKWTASLGAVGFVIALIVTPMAGPPPARAVAQSAAATGNVPAAATPPAAQAVAVQATVATPVAAPVVQRKASPPTYSEVLNGLRVSSYSWRRVGGMFMKANFVVHNDSSIAVKDVVVTCRHSANSGTIIDSNTRTLYEQIGSRSYLSVVEMDLGMISSHAVDSSCKVTAYSRVG